MLDTSSKFDEDGVRLDDPTGSLIRGVRRYLAELERIGIPRIMLNPDRCLTWDELEALLLSKSQKR